MKMKRNQLSSLIFIFQAMPDGLSTVQPIEALMVAVTS